jgi:SPP1 gp7 family putative phage head morphogenesis protein
MTVPLTQPQPADTSATPEERAVGALATFLAEASLVAAVALPPYLFAQLLRLGFRRSALKAALAIGLRGPLFHRPARGTPAGTAAGQVADTEPELRARYILNAARRITDDLDTVLPERVGPDGLVQPPPTEADRLEGATRREATYFDQHVNAQRNRRATAHAVDQVATESPWMQWVTANDDRVEADCRSLAGHVFSIDSPPLVHGRPTWPGAVHPRCRCTAAPFGVTLLGQQPTITSS